MIIGHVLDKRPRVKLAIHGRTSAITIEFAIDTGFDGFIGLPNTLLNRLDAVYDGNQIIETATGRQDKAQVFIGSVDWDSEERPVEILALDRGIPLVGVELLADHVLTVDMVDGGEVTIEPR